MSGGIKQRRLLMDIMIGLRRLISESISEEAHLGGSETLCIGEQCGLCQDSLNGCFNPEKIFY